jgi:hypothetical protein
VGIWIASHRLTATHSYVRLGLPVYKLADASRGFGQVFQEFRRHGGKARG